MIRTPADPESGGCAGVSAIAARYATTVIPPMIATALPVAPDDFIYTILSWLDEGDTAGAGACGAGQAGARRVGAGHPADRHPGHQPQLAGVTARVQRAGHRQGLS